MSKVSLSLQGKLLCVASDKIQALNKNQILENLYYHCDFDGYLILKDFSDDIDGDINKCYFLILFNEMCPLHHLVNILEMIST